MVNRGDRRPAASLDRAARPGFSIRNVHERTIAAEPSRVGALLGTLATPDDQIWPRDAWPPMRLDRPLAAGARGGHGPIRYTVEAWQPGQEIRFRFTGPAGFHGTHAFIVAAGADGGSVLRHELVMNTTGIARISWPLVFRPLHDALIEDALDRAAAACGQAAPVRRWSTWVRVLRGAFQRLAPARRAAATDASTPVYRA